QHASRETELGRQAGEIVAVGFGEHFARPADGLAADGATLVRRQLADRHEVVVAAHARDRVLAQQRQRLARAGVVPDDVTQMDDDLNVLPVDVGEHGGERVAIRVDVGEDGKAHGGYACIAGANHRWWPRSTSLRPSGVGSGAGAEKSVAPPPHTEWP